MSDSVNQARAFEVLTATPIRTRRTPRDWPDAEKARLIAETSNRPIVTAEISL
jgi:transposase